MRFFTSTPRREREKKVVPRRRKNEQGQVLILAVLAMIILVMATLFLFDIQNVVRIKVKAQTSVDAAALTAANWQRHSLNLIGEMNLIKACTVLVSDIPPYGDETTEGITSSSDLLTEMQTRVSFVGPLIGFGAAQQAAKNNGLNYNGGYCEVMKNHIERVEDDDIYGEGIVNPTINGYSWRAPYLAMLQMVYDDGKGIAVAPNTQYLGIPILSSDPPDFIGYLQSKWVYDAIQANYWCALRELLRMDFGPTGNKWWGNIDIMWDSSSFPQEAEYCPIKVAFTEGVGPYEEVVSGDYLNAFLAARNGLTALRDEYDEYAPGDDADADGKIDPLPLITWAVYDGSWSGYSPEVFEDWADYLRSDIRREFAYYGPVAKMMAEIPPATLSSDWGVDDAGDDQYIGDVVSFSDKAIDGSKSFSTYGSRLREAERQMKHGLEMINASALAKPLGSLDSVNDLPPNSVSMVLPVFSKSTLIPVALEDPAGFDPFDYKWYAFVTEYLPTLGTVNAIADMGPDVVPDPSHWPWFITYHNALLKLDNPDWRQQGIDWLETPIDWDDDTGTVTMTNEDTCDDWPPGGSGPHLGPDILH